MKKQNKNKKDELEELLTKLNSLALNVIDEIYEARMKKTSVDFESLKAPLLAIKEIKDLVKINDKVKSGKVSDVLELDEIPNTITLEEFYDEEIKE